MNVLAQRENLVIDCHVEIKSAFWYSDLKIRERPKLVARVLKYKDIIKGRFKVGFYR